MKQLYLFLLLLMSSCEGSEPSPKEELAVVDTSQPLQADTGEQRLAEYSPASKVIHTGSTTPAELIAFAESLTGTPYKYGSTDPAQGFDCSGFITYVFNHFHIGVPRSSVDFTDVAGEVSLSQARPGDLILFTGTDSAVRVVGHMGIITQADARGVSFIHSSSGKNSGVVTTALNNYYMGRFVKVVRVFVQNDKQ